MSLTVIEYNRDGEILNAIFSDKEKSLFGKEIIKGNNIFVLFTDDLEFTNYLKSILIKSPLVFQKFFDHTIFELYAESDTINKIGLLTIRKLFSYNEIEDVPILSDAPVNRIDFELVQNDNFKIDSELNNNLLIYKSVIEQTSDMIAVVDDEYKYILANDAFINSRNLELNQVLGKSILQIEGEEVFNRVIKHQIEKCFKGQVVEFETEFNHRGFGQIFLFMTYYPLKINSNDFNRVIVYIRNITQKKRSELALIDSENKFRTLFENANTGIAFIDAKGIIISVNYALETILGYSAEELNGRYVIDFTHPDDIENEFLLLKEIRNKSREKFRTEKRYIKKDGSSTWVDLSVSVIRNKENNPEFFVGVLSVIDNRKQAEIALATSESKFRALYEQLSDATYIVGLDARILDCNPQASKMLGYSKKELTSMSVIDIDYDFNTRENEHHFWEQLPVDDFVRFESYHHDKEQNIIPVEVSLGIVFINHEKLVLGLVRDISQRKAAERALKESESRLKQLLETSPIPTIVVNNEMNPVGFNQKFQEIIGYDLNDIPTMSDWWLKAYPDENYRNDLMSLWGTKFIDAKKNNLSMMDAMTVDITCKDGNVRSFEVNVPIFRDYGLITFTDLTERIKLEGSLKQLNDELENRVIERTEELENAYKKLEDSLIKEKQYSEMQKRFIDLISHEYRTPLTIISTSASVVDMKIKKNDPSDIDKFLSRIQVSVDTLAQLIEDVITFSKSQYEDQEVYLTKIGINDFLKKTVPSIMMMDKGNHNFDINYLQDEVYIDTDTKFLRQVITQIVLNATKFSDNNTRIILTLKETIDALCIQISDQGVGISEEDIPRLFEPFYKSKVDIGLKSGTGLGLPIAKKLIQLLNGEIIIQSELGKGSTFSICLKKN